MSTRFERSYQTLIIILEYHVEEYCKWDVELSGLHWTTYCLLLTMMMKLLLTVRKLLLHRWQRMFQLLPLMDYQRFIWFPAGVSGTPCFTIMVSWMMAMIPIAGMLSSSAYRLGVTGAGGIGLAARCIVWRADLATSLPFEDWGPAMTLAISTPRVLAT